MIALLHALACSTKGTIYLDDTNDTEPADTDTTETVPDPVSVSTSTDEILGFVAGLDESVCNEDESCETDVSWANSSAIDTFDAGYADGSKFADLQAGAGPLTYWACQHFHDTDGASDVTSRVSVYSDDQSASAALIDQSAYRLCAESPELAYAPHLSAAGLLQRGYDAYGALFNDDVSHTSGGNTASAFAMTSDAPLLQVVSPEAAEPYEFWSDEGIDDEIALLQGTNALLEGAVDALIPDAACIDEVAEDGYHRYCASFGTLQPGETVVEWKD